MSGGSAVRHRFLRLGGRWLYDALSLELRIIDVQSTLEQHGLGAPAPDTVENTCLTLGFPET